MKKTLLVGTMVVALSAVSLSADAFCWRNLNPANWGTCPKCEKTASTCGCKKDKCNSKYEKEKKCCPAKDKCQSQTPKCDSDKTTTPCNPCDKLQQKTERE